MIIKGGHYRQKNSTHKCPEVEECLICSRKAQRSPGWSTVKRKWKITESESEVTQSCPTLSDPMDCSLPGSSIHGIFQARVLEWGAIAFSNEKGSGGSTDHVGPCRSCFKRFTGHSLILISQQHSQTLKYTLAFLFIHMFLKL